MEISQHYTFPHSLKGQRYGGLHALMSSMKELRSKSSVMVDSLL